MFLINILFVFFTLLILYNNLLFPLQQTTIIAKATQSLKVLAELPIIVVLMYQVCFVHILQFVTLQSLPAPRI